MLSPVRPPITHLVVELATITTAATFVAIGALIGSFVLAMVRLLTGPSLPDRVIALDLLAFIIIAFIIVYAVYSGEQAYLNVALTVALVAFLGTIAFARFIERRSRTRAGAGSGE